METFLYLTIMTLFIAVNLFDFAVRKLNLDAGNETPKAPIDDLYDKDEYARWRKYSEAHTYLSLQSGFLSFTFVLVMLMFGGFRALGEWSEQMADSLYGETLFFLGVLYGLEFIYASIVRYIRVFKIEEAYGFNRSTKKTFFTDRLKAFILGAAFGTFILLSLLWLYETYQSRFILYGFLLIFVLSLLLNLFYTRLILPLFSKLTPLEEGELSDKIHALAYKEGYQVKAIKVMDASRRSSKLNAFFSGFGRLKTVVLFDTLLEAMDEEAILAVLAHEIGHSKHKDILKNLLIQSGSVLLTLGLLSLFITYTPVYRAFGFDTIHIGFGLLLFGIVLSPLNLLLGALFNKMSRAMELKADRYAARAVSKDAMEHALRTLSKKNFAHLTPHPLYVKLYYSHPPLSRRIENIREVAYEGTQAQSD
ncbi:MAG: M48 family metallopeptidase [Bacillota bacterium]